jgi:hypothetical protein
MKRGHNLIIIGVILLLINGCKKEIESKVKAPIIPPTDSLYAKTEKIIRKEYDFRAVFTWNQYLDLLNKLKQDKFIVMPINEMRNTFDVSKVVVGLRHDIDFNPFKALEMSKIEKDNGIRSTYYILATADYYGYFNLSGVVRNRSMSRLYKELYNNGAEIGIHNDLLTVMISDKLDPFVFNQNELSYYDSLNIPIYGTAAHGSQIAKVSVPNYMIFSDFAKVDSVLYEGKKYPMGQHSLKEYGFEYEANFINFNIYFSDSRGKWNDPAGFNGILTKLDSCKPGDRIQILAHPDWWGK